jgi:uncharacterized SAM-binding protein YcdF (DUF218 family)
MVGFTLGKLLAALTGPANFLMLIAAVGAIAIGRRWGRRLLVMAVLAMVLIATTPVANWFLWPLEQRFPAPNLDTLPEVDGIIILGGAIMPVGSAEHGSPQLTRDAERLTVLPGLMRRYPHARIVFAGGSGDPRQPDSREAPFVAMLFHDWGLDGARILYEGASRDTWENAENSRSLITGERWLLVTSAAHMPRSMGVFRLALPDVAFIAFPVGYNANRSERWRFGLNLADNLSMLETAAHEWRGLLAYRLSGRIATIFPTP